MKGNQVVSLALLGLVGYILYEHFALGQSWQSSVSFIPGGSALAKSAGLTGCGCSRDIGLGMLASVEGPFSGYRPISSGLPMRSELNYASRV
jgi:hypothetical protein